MAVPVLATFDLTHRDQFQEFIWRMRRDLVNRLPHPDELHVASTSVPRLPPQRDPANAELKDLVIRDEDGREITLRLRTDNLYVVGFRNADGAWFEFDHDDGNRDRMIQGSTYLGFTGSYTSNGGLGDLDDVVQDGALILGESAVREAVINLARYTGENRRDDRVKRSLRSLIVNFIESIRFNPVLERVNAVMWETVPETETDAERKTRELERDRQRRLTMELAKLLRSWRSLSGSLVSAAANPNVSFESYRTAGVYNIETAATTLGMLLIGFAVSRSSSASKPKGGRKLLVADDGDAVGLTLVEVVGVLIEDIDRENPGELYGTIRITDGFGTETLFNRGPRGFQSVGPGGWADLTWPTRALSGGDDFVIDVHLMDYDTLWSFSRDDQVADGQVAWNSRDTARGDYDTLRSKRVHGKKGSVQVNYAVLTQAVVAAVQVQMLDGDGESRPVLYGTVTATTKTSSGEKLEYRLFDRQRATGPGVRKGTNLPLSRKVISVPLCSELQIDANLWDRDRDWSPDDQIALGSAIFEPELEGSASQEISGQYGKVKVQVTWLTSFQYA